MKIVLLIEVVLNDTNLAFLSKINIKGFKKSFSKRKRDKDDLSGNRTHNTDLVQKSDAYPTMQNRDVLNTRSLN